MLGLKKVDKRSRAADGYPVPSHLISKYITAKLDSEHGFIDVGGPAGSEDILLRIIFQLEARIQELEERK